jgi:hypothetical protein
LALLVNWFGKLAQEAYLVEIAEALKFILLETSEA